MNIRRPATVNYERCTICRAVRPPEKMMHISHVIPQRKRGWICDARAIGNDPERACLPAVVWAAKQEGIAHKA